MKKIWINKAKSFKDAEQFDIEYYSGMSNKERLETVQFLREIYYKFNRKNNNENRKKLRRTIRFIKQK